MTTRKVLLIGLGAFALMAVTAIVAIILFIAHVSEDVKGVAINIKSPTEVVVGEEFDLEISVKNERKGEAFELSDIDIAEVYLDGFIVGFIKPTPKSNMHVPIDKSRSFSFDHDIPADSSQTFVFKLRAEKEGIFRGDVDVCEGTRFITNMAQTAVIAKPLGKPGK